MSAGIVTLTEKQAHMLIHDEWDGTGPVRISEALSLDDLATSSVVPNAHLLMAELAGGGARLTAKGNLNRKLVESLVGCFGWVDYDPRTIREMNKVVNEEDFAPLHYLRIVLKLAGLVRPEKGVLKLTRKGGALSANDAAGQLQATLFRTTFIRYNPAYLDRYDLQDVFSWQISLVLYLIGQFADDWRPADALMRSVTLPVDEEQPERVRDMLPWAFEARVLRYLHWFGLVERKAAAANDDWRQPRLYRKTALYDRMLTFVL